MIIVLHQTFATRKLFMSGCCRPSPPKTLPLRYIAAPVDSCEVQKASLAGLKPTRKADPVPESASIVG